VIKRSSVVDREKCDPAFLNGWPVWYTGKDPVRVCVFLYRRLLPVVVLGHLFSTVICIVYSVLWSVLIGGPKDPYSAEIGWVFAPVLLGTILITVSLLFACFLVHVINLFIGRLMTPIVAGAFICGLSLVPLNVLYLLPYAGQGNFHIAVFSYGNFVIATTMAVVYGIIGAETSIVRTKKPLQPFRFGIRSIMAIVVCVGIVSAIDGGSFYFFIPFWTFVGVTYLTVYLHYHLIASRRANLRPPAELTLKTKQNFAQKSTVQQIRERFDQDVERFSNLETGQKSTIDAPLAMELITQAAIVSTPAIHNVLDIGCGAGNNSIKLRQDLGSDFDITFIDLSRPMLNKAKERFEKINRGDILLICDDFRTTVLQPETYDVVLAAAVLHHLRDDFDWRSAFAKIYKLLKPGGSFWITDLVDHQSPAIKKLMWDRYGEYLESIDGREYREKVFEYIGQEDSPRSVPYQMNLLYEVGFQEVEILHKNSCFAAFGAIK